MKYEYCIYTWGGFYGEEFCTAHKESPGYHYFESKEGRDSYKAKLKEIEKRLSAKYLMTEEWEGLDARVPVTLHRTMVIEGFEVTTHHNMAPVRNLESAINHLENRWYPGCNDEPFGDSEEFDYSNVKIIKEWITGPFDTWVSSDY